MMGGVVYFLFRKCYYYNQLFLSLAKNFRNKNPIVISEHTTPTTMQAIAKKSFFPPNTLVVDRTIDFFPSN